MLTPDQQQQIITIYNDPINNHFTDDELKQTMIRTIPITLEIKSEDRQEVYEFINQLSKETI